MAELTIEVRDNGPLRIRGPVVVHDAHGNALELAPGPVALCRCGQSAGKPFCDATHRAIAFESAPRAGEASETP